MLMTRFCYLTLDNNGLIIHSVGLSLIHIFIAQILVRIDSTRLVPGTFQHSMQVANLAAEAANRIGAKSQLVRTGCLLYTSRCV